jgi:hypothetical protein
MMAGRTLKRRELRKQSDEAERAETAETAPKAPARAKKEAKPKEAKPAKPKRAGKNKTPVRWCARWGVFDNGMKQVAIFNYNQRAEADQKVAELTAKKKAVHFLQIVKEPMPEPPPAELAPA